MWLNTLCRDPACLKRKACAHTGPGGELCFFETEKELCSILNIEWKQELSLRYLLNEVRYRITGKAALPESNLPSFFNTVPGGVLKEAEAEVNLTDDT
jgi:hypothetical protein